MTAAFVLMAAVTAVCILVVHVAYRLAADPVAEQPRVDLWADLAAKAEANR